MPSRPATGGPRSPGTADGTPSMNDVARHAGVALGTVSNVLNNPHKVADRTRRRVEAAIADLGFVRNSAARTLAAGATDNVGLVLVDIGNSLFVDIARGVESATSAAGLKLLLANSDVDQTKQDAYLHLFDEARVAGLLLAPLDGPLDAAHVVQSHGRPVLLINAPTVDEGMCTVSVNEELGGHLAAQHLLDQGARRLAFLGGPFGLRAISRRLDGVRRAADEGGADLTTIETPRLNIGDGRIAGRTLLESSPRVDGIVCASDPLAVGVLQAATDLAISVPEQLVVIGYDDNHFASESAIPVSTIAQPGRRMGEVATELLLQEINDTAGHRHAAVVLDPQLIARRSTERLGRSVAAV
jgi:LacI family transcriptional regulator